MVETNCLHVALPDFRYHEQINNYYDKPLQFGIDFSSAADLTAKITPVSFH